MTDRSSPPAEDVSAGEPHAERLKEWFELHATEWTEAYRSARRVNDMVLVDRKRIAGAFVLDHAPLGGRILDAGCGAGWATLDLARAGFWVHGVDLAQEMIDQSRRTFAEQGIAEDRYALTRGDLLTLDLSPESFDGIQALGVMQYQLLQAPLLERFHGLLRPGGILVITGPIERGIPNLFGTPATAGALLRRVRRVPPPDTTGLTQHRYGVARARRLLEAAGFEVVGHRGHGFGDWYVVGGLIGFRGELALHRLFTWLARFTPVGRWGNDLVIAARKPAKVPR